MAKRVAGKAGTARWVRTEVKEVKPVGARLPMTATTMVKTAKERSQMGHIVG